MNGQDDRIIGGSPLLMRVLHAARMVAATEASVLIHGEQGAGRSLLAEQIHRWSRLGDRPLRRINCSGITSERLEAALADEGRAVSGGVFLERVDELPESLQPALLQRLEQERARVRWLASAGNELSERVAAGEFHPALYYRLNVVPIDLPPLRERSEDVVALLNHFTRRFAQSHQRRAPRYSVSARNLLKAYPWPGNVQELRNLCERLVILHAGTTLQPDDLPLEIRRGGVQSSSPFRLPPQGIRLAELESDLLRQALGMSGGNRSRAARLLGISRDTLLYRLRKYAVE